MNFTLKFNLNAQGLRRDAQTYIAFSADKEFKKFVKDIGAQWAVVALGYRIPKEHVKDLVATIADRFPEWNATDERTDGLENAPPKRECEYSDAGVLLSEKWMFDGMCHRPDGPAYKVWDVAGNLTREQWMIDGETHRIDGPARILWDIEAHRRREMWYSNGKCHRIDGPADCAWESGDIIHEMWVIDSNTFPRSGSLNDKSWYHRTDGPAIRTWNPETREMVEQWTVNGKIHRTDGPAITLRDAEGNPVDTWLDTEGNPMGNEWWLGNVRITQKEHRRAFVLQSARAKVLRAARLLALGAEVTSVTEDILSAVGQFL